jgi:hypothetical protein
MTALNRGTWRSPDSCLRFQPCHRLLHLSGRLAEINRVEQATLSGVAKDRKQGITAFLVHVASVGYQARVCKWRRHAFLVTQKPNQPPERLQTDTSFA